jgi:uncharacterized protein
LVVICGPSKVSQACIKFNGNKTKNFACRGKEPTLKYYLLIYHVIDDYVARRAPLREEHLRLARDSQSRGELILGGALADPVDMALLVFRAPDSSAAESFVQNDPYIKNGLVKKWEIRPWTVVIEQQNSE